MASITYKFTFTAKDKSEIEEKIKTKISQYIGEDVENPLRYVNYEAVLTDNYGIDKYHIDVTARIKNDN